MHSDGITFVTPAKAGVHVDSSITEPLMDSRFRGNDEKGDPVYSHTLAGFRKNRAKRHASTGGLLMDIPASPNSPTSVAASTLRRLALPIMKMAVAAQRPGMVAM